MRRRWCRGGRAGCRWLAQGLALLARRVPAELGDRWAGEGVARARGRRGAAFARGRQETPHTGSLVTVPTWSSRRSLTAEEAVGERFADEVEEGARKAQVFGLSRFRRVPERLAAAAAADLAARPEPPRVAEIAAPRVCVDPPPCGTSRAARRRILDVLRVTT